MNKLIIMLLLIVLPINATAETNIYKLMNDGIDLYKKNKFKGAEKNFLSAVVYIESGRSQINDRDKKEIYMEACYFVGMINKKLVESEKNPQKFEMRYTAMKDGLGRACDLGHDKACNELNKIDAAAVRIHSSFDKAVKMKSNRKKEDNENTN